MSRDLLTELQRDGFGHLISKTELAEIMRCSISKINAGITQSSGIPNYFKMGDTKQSKVMFKLTDVVDFLESNYVRTV